MASTNVLSVPSWEALSERAGLNSKVPIRLPEAEQRLFGGGNKQAALIFYRDNSSWCPYCERVWIQLEEKEIPYSVQKINMRCYGEKPAWYTRMVPSGLLPAVELNQKVLTESLDIMMALEKAFPDHRPLLPAPGSAQADAVNSLLKLERSLVGEWLRRLRGAWAWKGGFESAMGKVDSALRRFDGPYFLGKEFSLVDAVYAPFLERIAASMPYWQGLIIRGSGQWPAVEAWFDSMDSRSSFQAVKSDDFTITHTLEPQIGPCLSLPAGAEYRAMVDGRNGSWDLPLKPEQTAWGMDDGSDSMAKVQAARTLARNHHAVVGFALRGLKDGENYREAVDLGFRYVAYALLVGYGDVDSLQELPKQVAEAAAYLRDRVGVPRDLSYPAARQLRAHLHWLVKLVSPDLHFAT
ncbi:hypothetical protein O6H91_04G045500 [Diphasiastrum complanatum]|nr:hypothetical protein O6H91_04G045500 [Diphasiastrum complanatum]